MARTQVRDAFTVYETSSLVHSAQRVAGVVRVLVENSIDSPEASALVAARVDPTAVGPRVRKRDNYTPEYEAERH